MVNRISFTMHSSRNMSQPSRPLLLPKLILIVFVCALAATASVDAFVGVIRNNNPKLALRLMPNDAQALLAASDQILLENQSGKLSTSAKLQIQEMAIRSIRQQAINPNGLRQLGLVSNARPDQSPLARYLSLGLKLSKREPAVNISLIEQFAQLDRVEDVLKIYDLALRTNPVAYQLLLDRLAAALPDAAIRKALLPYVKGSAPWLPQFISHAIQSNVDGGAIVALIDEANGLPRGKLFEDLEGYIVKKLLAEGKLQKAITFYASLRTGKPNLTSETDFSAKSIDPRFSPLTWQILEVPGVEASFVSNSIKNDVHLEIEASGERQSTILRKLLVLRPNLYQTVSSPSPLAGNSPTAWTLKCDGSGNEGVVWKIDLRASGTLDLRNSRCDVYRIELWTLENRAPYSAIVLPIALVKTESQ
jgi:hypothetical protein